MVVEREQQASPIKPAASRGKSIVMVGTSLQTKGGISAVVNVYKQAGFFDRWGIVYISSHVDGSYAVKVWMAVRGMTRYVWYLVRGRVALVHVHSASNASFWRKAIFILLAYLARRPVVFHLHGGGFVHFFEHECGTLGQYIIRSVLDRAAFILVMSKQWKADLGRITHNRNIVPVYNPVSTAVIRGGEMTTRQGHVLLFLARVSKEKGIYDLVRAVSQLSCRGRQLVLRVAGDGDTTAVQSMAQQLGISSQLELLGWTTGAAKARLLAESAVFVLPSYFEGLPMGLLEAMAAGLPVVATRVGAIPEVVRNGVEGFLLVPGDVDALTTALDRLLADSQLRQRMGEAGRSRIIENFLPECVLPRIEAVYRSMGVLDSGAVQ